jgi:hypothetical protein
VPIRNPTAGQPLPHAVSSISGAVNTSFAYDGNGNQTTGAGLTYIYTSYNKPHSISRAAATILFADDADHQRFQQFSSAGTTTYMAASGTMAERLDGSGGSTQWTNYLVAGGGNTVPRCGGRPSACGSRTAAPSTSATSTRAIDP